MRYLSDVNLRAVLNVLVARAGGSVEITNAELYDAMLPDSGHAEGVHVEELPDGLRLTLAPGAEPEADPGGGTNGHAA
jgi:hypothetical protein